MTKKNLADSVLEKIKECHITPRPRWHYIVKDALFWGVYFLSILLGSLGMAVILYALFDTDFDLLSYMPTSQLGSFLKLLPIVWLILFSLFVALAIWGAQHTKKGYKLSIIILLGANFLVSLILGGVIYASGGSERIEHVFARGVPFYQRFEERRKDLWKRRDAENLLAGSIVKVEEGKIIILNDLSGEQWEVDCAQARYPEWIEFTVGMKIRMFGEKTGEYTFKALGIRPWERRGIGEGKRRPFFLPTDIEKKGWR